MKDMFNNDLYLDVMREIGTIGSGNALSSLSSMMANPVNMIVPVVKTMEYSQVLEDMGGPEQMLVGLLLTLGGDVEGMIMFLLHKDFAHVMLNTLLGKKIENFEQIDEMGYSALKEVSSIMAGSYCNVISSMTGLTIKISTPDITVDMLGAIISVPTIYYANISDRIIYIEGGFSGNGLVANCHILMIPDEVSLKKILTNLGLEG
ncbi:MAG: chemotaxis protein CheC [Oscillospiraceae bacterium]|jgi:chemotaxis protein CheC|nr:chemotaxis protein CheC [Oscillospiraceae bacterium]